MPPIRGDKTAAIRIQSQQLQAKIEQAGLQKQVQLLQEQADTLTGAGHFTPLEFAVGRFVLVLVAGVGRGRAVPGRAELSARRLGSGLEGVNGSLTLQGRQNDAEIGRQIADMIGRDFRRHKMRCPALRAW